MKWLLRVFVCFLVLAFLIFLFYCNNLALVNKQAVSFYKELKKELKEHGYNPRLLVISTKRLPFHNNIQVKFSGAASKSKHLDGDAIDFLVFDVNNDGEKNSKDVDIVTELLENKIMKDKGGIGTYKKDRFKMNRQMIHIDCRDKKGRWNR